MSTLQKLAVSIFSYFILFTTSHSQHQNYSNTEIQLSLAKLKVLGSVLYLAAHPDDENTSVITFMSKGKLTRTAYLSLTRGDGGQNLLGNEKGDLLGVVRTQELLSARQIDGGEQFFTRAVDFGYSKTSKETLKNWDREILLGDIVKVIREFKPDIILTRFSKTQGGHGQHLASAILAEEAFHAAADINKYPEQLNELEPWQARRLYWNTWQPTSDAIAIDIGEYNSILGKSYNEISADARSMHKSQGFGVSPTRGTQLVYFDYMAGDTASKSLFDDIELSWNRVSGGNSIEKKIDVIIDNYDPAKPYNIVNSLVDLYNEIGRLDNVHWVKLKQNEIKNLIKKCSGLWMESLIWEPELSRGEEITVRPSILNRSQIPIKLENVKTSFANLISEINQKLIFNETFTLKQRVTIPKNYNYSQPYWLHEWHDGKFFTINNSRLIGDAENDADINTEFQVNINGTSLIYKIPAVHKWNDAVKGEQIRPIVVRPDLSISVDQETLVFPNGTTHPVNVNLVSKVDSAKGKLFIELPLGWSSSSEYFDFNLTDKGDKTSFTFSISPNKNASNGIVKFRADMNGSSYSDEIVQISYHHIKHQTVLKPVQVNLVKLDIEVEPKTIGYIMGSGDEIPNSLAQLGYIIDLLSDEDLDRTDLNKYDVIICGIRAFNTRKELERQQKRIIQFVESGGTWIVQHNTRFGINVEQIGPYPFNTSGRDRIAEENAELEILIPEHKIFNYPNKISKSDFDGWVQERGLYFANSWEGKLYPLLAGSDEGESSKLGSLLFANHGRGVFIFTALSWFRQLPAGVPGAFKIFVNLISAKGK